MARNGSGTYNLLTNSWNPATNGVSATAVDWQNLINDVASALTQSLSADGQTPITGNLNAGNNKITGLAAGTGAGQSIRWEQVFTAPASFGGGAINVDAAGNVGIAGTFGGAAVNVDVAGNFGVGTSSTSGYKVVFKNGAKSQFFTTDATSSYYYTDGSFFFGAIGANNVVAVTNNIERMRIDASGNVGIGTSSPATKLNVIGDLQLSRSATASDAAINFGSNANNYIYSGNSSNVMVFATNGTERARITSDGLFQFNSGYGSVATAFGCRAWVNFDGTGTVGLRGSGNVSSITDNGVGDYTVNFTTAMPDLFYAKNIICQGIAGNNQVLTLPDFGPSGALSAPTVSSFRFMVVAPGTGFVDSGICNVSIFR